MYNILCDNCEWNQWEELGIDDTIEGPVESDHYNGPHVWLKNSTLFLGHT